jgi:serpin B
VWLDGTYAQFRREYLRDIERLGVGSAHAVSFGEKDKASDEINAWVWEKTHGRIAGSMQPADFESRSQPGVIDEPALVSLNAVYFKAEWTSRFVSRDTAKRTFHTVGGTDMEVPMMHQSSPFLYSENERFKFLEMPYRGGLYSMIVPLPREHADPQGMVAAVTPEAVVDLKKERVPAPSGCAVSEICDLWSQRREKHPLRHGSRTGV